MDNHQIAGIHAQVGRFPPCSIGEAVARTAVAFRGIDRISRTPSLLRTSGGSLTTLPACGRAHASRPVSWPFRGGCQKPTDKTPAAIDTQFIARRIRRKDRLPIDEFIKILLNHPFNCFGRPH
jgi:hypothetical protein